MLEAWFICAPSRLFFQAMLVGIDLLPQHSSRGITVVPDAPARHLRTVDIRSRVSEQSADLGRCARSLETECSKEFDTPCLPLLERLTTF